MRWRWRQGTVEMSSHEGTSAGEVLKLYAAPSEGKSGVPGTFSWVPEQGATSPKLETRQRGLLYSRQQPS